MTNKVCFSAFDSMVGDSPELCDLCRNRVPIFKYQCSSGRDREQREYLIGFCCLSCTQRLLENLRQSESRYWAEEEAALADDEVDVIDFHRRRIAAFGSRCRGFGNAGCECAFSSQSRRACSNQRRPLSFFGPERVTTVTAG
jgi:hypothetical protein